mgnify:CR=1 FL=1
MRIQRLGYLTIGLACLAQLASPAAQAHGVARLVGMWECSGNQSDSYPWASTSRASSIAPIVWSVGKISTPMCMVSTVAGIWFPDWYERANGP